MSTSTSSDLPSARCRLLELPRELRDLIYEYALTEEDGLKLYQCRTQPPTFKALRFLGGTYCGEANEL